MSRVSPARPPAPVFSSIWRIWKRALFSLIASSAAASLGEAFDEAHGERRLALGEAVKPRDEVDVGLHRALGVGEGDPHGVRTAERRGGAAGRRHDERKRPPPRRAAGLHNAARRRRARDPRGLA